MAHAGTGVGGGDGGGTAGIAEEIQHVDLTAGGADGFDFGGKPIPVYGLFGEKPGVFKTGGMDLEGQCAVADCPVIGEQVVAYIPICRRRFRCGGRSRPSLPIS